MAAQDDAEFYNASQESLEKFREDYRERKSDPFRMTLEQAYAAGFSAGHRHGRATMVGALIRFAEIQEKGEPVVEPVVQQEPAR
ncbi:MAG TPA: hypothetical protein VE967_19540 [Gemmatimonadaceae bacterium]|nr:hypothetical protein [Gemmatimonadaceae bacterium]